MKAGLLHVGSIGLILWAGAVSAAASGTSAPDFELLSRDSMQKVSLANLKRRVVVLDFFAHWCVPCVRCSSEVETGIRQYYQHKTGNAREFPVEVLAINIETARPDKTEAFIKRAGLTDVLEDPQGAVFKEYGGTGLPYLVIIDATGPDNPVIAYKKAGFDGVAKLREAIDSLRIRLVAAPTDVQSPTPSTRTPDNEKKEQGPDLAPALKPQLATPEIPQSAAPEMAETKAPPPRPDRPEAAVEPTLRPAVEVLHKAGLDFALLWAKDVLLTDEMIEYRQTWPRTELAFSLSGGSIGLDYVPESRLEEPKDIASGRLGFQVNDRFKATDRVTLLAGGGVYYGYMDYRSLWFDEHFRQLYSRRPGYKKAYPWGYNASAGARWEYLPAAGFVQGNLLFAEDWISPGYDVALQPFPPRLVRFRDKYDTVSGRLTLENVLTKRVRALQELQITDTTDRRLRFSLQSSLNVAPAEHWVGRLILSGTKENPQFESWYVGAVVERDWNETWFLSVMGRFYKDTGQIENALLAENTAAPPLEAFEAGLGLRWQGANSSVKLSAGPYFTRYEPPTLAQATFGHLYQNRDWFSAQLAFTHQF